MHGKTKNIFLVIPTARSVDVLKTWKQELCHIHVIIVEDFQRKTVKVPRIPCRSLQIYSWKDIERELGECSWIISRRNSGIRAFGFLKAYQQKADVIVTIDDDCYPLHEEPYFIRQHIENLSLKVPNRWINTYPDRQFLYTRGIPYLIRSESPVVLSHGLWTNVLDLDAPTHLQYLSFRAQFAENFLQIIPKGTFFPFCSMNFAFRAEITPLLYFPLMGEDNQKNRWGYDRFDDIWAGLYAKKILDHLGLSVLNGSPFVEHRKASDPFINLKKEASGITTNEILWKLIDGVELREKTPIACYRELNTKLQYPNTPYFTNLKQAIYLWLDLF